MSFAKSPLILALVTLPSLITSSCYSRNGTLITDIAYQPCSSIGESACCGTNHDGAGHTNVANDVCETNGLCQNYEAFDGTNEGVKLWWRQGCTDPEWKSPNCLASVCDTEEYEDDNAPVYSCGNGNWACGKKSYCSTSSRLFTLAATVGKEVVVSTSASASASMTSVVTASLSSAPASTTSTSASSDNPSSLRSSSTPTKTASSTQLPAPISSGLGTGAKAGIGAGIAVFILLLGIILFLLHKIKKDRKTQQAWDKTELPGQSAPPAAEGQQTVVYTRAANSNPVELPGNEATAYEMNGQKERTELESQERAQEVGQGRQ